MPYLQAEQNESKIYNKAAPRHLLVVVVNGTIVRLRVCIVRKPGCMQRCVHCTEGHAALGAHFVAGLLRIHAKSVSAPVSRPLHAAVVSFSVCRSPDALAMVKTARRATESCGKRPSEIKCKAVSSANVMSFIRSISYQSSRTAWKTTQLCEWSIISGAK